MLSKIVPAKKADTVEFQHYEIPSLDQIDQIVADKKRDAQRAKLIEDHKDDPLQAARKEANKILVEAQEKLKEAELEGNAIKVRKEKEIRAQLEKEYTTKFQNEIKALSQSFANSVEMMLNLKETIYKQSEKELMTLVFSITRKIIGEEIKTNPQVVMEMLQKGFEKMKEAKQYEIRIHPADYETVAALKDSLKAKLNISGNISFTRDEGIERGGCQIISESGHISSEPGKQMEIIMKELMNGT